MNNHYLDLQILVAVLTLIVLLIMVFEPVICNLINKSKAEKAYKERCKNSERRRNSKG